MRNELYDRIMLTLGDRSNWENRQAAFYEMRHNGLRRKKLPFPGAADLHYPMADSMIEKHKPFYYQILFGQDLIAIFNSMKIEQEADASGIAHWFDYKMKQKTNIETEILVAIDFMLMCGRSVMKVTYDTENKKLKFGGIDPVFFIVPGYTDSLADADMMTEVKQLSVHQYKRMAGDFNKDEDYVKRITGANAYSDQKTLIKYRREGINVPLDENQLLLWETYEHTSDGWMVHWFSPALPNEPARPSEKLVKPYKCPPYIDFYTEVKDKGYYSPRGIPEIIAVFEAFLTKSLNESSDFQTFTNRPIYTSEGQIVNMQNYKLTPGQYVPNNLRRVEQGPPPIPFEQMETKMRSIAEYRIGMPDFGMGQQQSSGKKGDNPTATEVRAITSLMGQTVDLRVRLFRKSLANLFLKSWELFQYYEKDSLEYFQKNQMKKLPPEIMDLDYSIEPSVSVDNWNRSLVLQKAAMRREMFRGVPWINQQELDKSVLEADDPRLIDRLFVDPNMLSADQAEEQADEIGNMMIGFPVQISPQDDDMVHLITIVQFVQALMAQQKTLESQPATLILTHGGMHQQKLESSPEGKAKLKGMDMGVVGAAIGYLQSMAQTEQNILPMNGAPPGVAPATPGAPPTPALPAPAGGVA